ncbi:MAG TPA: hypothetical protein VF818_06120 [Ktedonobacterales bacterium]
MDATKAPPGLPGTSAAGLELVAVLIFGPVVLIMLALHIVTLLFPVPSPQGHLPWPLVQWAVTTPLGYLALTAVGAVIMVVPFIVLQWRTWPGASPARAADVTGLPPWMWPTRARMSPGETWRERWLGRDPGARRASVAILVGAALLALLLVTVLFASFAGVVFLLFSHTCRAQDCLANPYVGSVMSIAVGSELVALTLMRLASYLRLRRVERESGVWLRSRDIWMAIPLYYIRRPGVTHDAATTTLARFGPSGAPPTARAIAVAVLAITPMALLLGAAIFLSMWLPTQWIPT